MRISDWSSDVCSSDLRIALYLDEGSKYITVRNNVVDDAGKWLNINAVTPAVKMWLRVSTDNLATGHCNIAGGFAGGWTANLTNGPEVNLSFRAIAYPPDPSAVWTIGGLRPARGHNLYGTWRAGHKEPKRVGD